MGTVIDKHISQPRSLYNILPMLAVLIDLSFGLEGGESLDTKAGVLGKVDVATMAGAWRRTLRGVVVDVLATADIDVMGCRGARTWESVLAAIPIGLGSTASTQASLPSTQLWPAPVFPQFSNHEPPGAQQLAFPEFLKIPHFEQGELRTSLASLR